MKDLLTVISRIKYWLNVKDHECVFAAAIAARKNHDLAVSRFNTTKQLFETATELPAAKPMPFALMQSVESADFNESEVMEDLCRVKDGKGLKYTKLKKDKTR